MSVIYQRTLFDALALEVVPIGQTGYLLPVESSKLCIPLDIPDDWFLHNYLLVRRGSGSVRIAYVGETAGRIERVAEDNAGTKRDAMGLALLFFHRGTLLGSTLRKSLESRLYFALRKEPSWHFVNRTRGLGCVTGGLRNPAYLDLCVDAAVEYLSQNGLLDNPTSSVGWRPDKEKFEMAIEHRGNTYLAFAHITSLQKWEVAAGSIAKADQGKAHDDHRDLREKLISDGVLHRVERGLYRFSRDCEFDHPTTAAGVIAGQNSAGKRSWRQQVTGLPICYCPLPDVLVGRWPTRP